MEFPVEKVLPLIFVSCGQSTSAERELGKEIVRLVERHTGCAAYFAENQSTLEGVTDNILKKLNDAVAVIAIMHPRGNVTNPTAASRAVWVRASVWIEQEVAIAAFVSQALNRPMQVRCYVHETIEREGLRDKLILNPIKFLNDSDVLADLSSFLPMWGSLGQQQKKEPLSLRAVVKHQRVAIPGGGTNDERYLLLVAVENDGELDATDFRLDVELPAAFLDGGGYRLQRQSARAGFVKFQITNRDPACQMEHLYPGDTTLDLISFHYAITETIKSQHPEMLKEELTATVFSRDMRRSAALASGCSESQRFLDEDEAISRPAE